MHPPRTAASIRLEAARPARALLVLAWLLALAAVLCATLGPQPLVAGVRTELTRQVDELGAAWGVSTGVGGVDDMVHVLLFVPLGALVVATARSMRAWPTLLVLALPALAEATQTMLPARMVDPRDVLLDSIGLAAGLLLVGAVRLRRSSVRGRRRLRTTVVAAVALGAATALALLLLPQRPTSPTPSGSFPIAASTTEEPGTEDGRLDDGAVSPFADVPAITRLDPALQQAVQAAARDAEADGVAFVITSGWRSARYQQRLLDDALSEYGDAEEASRWVSSPEASEHVRGDAVDVGYTDADSWLEQHGARYGVCRIYANEMWHFELATEPGGICPAQWEDAAARDAARR